MIRRSSIQRHLALVALTLTKISTMTAFAFTTTSQPLLRKELRLFSQATGEEAYPTSLTRDTTEEIETITHITDKNYYSILHNTLSLPVLIDCYVAQCGPCKLIEQSLAQVLPRYTDPINEQLLFCKWNVDKKDESEEFMNILREHEMTFRKLPTLLLFVEGVPIAMRSGMATAGQVERFLDENVPKQLESLFVPTLRRRNAGGV